VFNTSKKVSNQGKRGKMLKLGVSIPLLLELLLLLAAINPVFTDVKAQGAATVIILYSSGGIIQPVPGTHTYPDGTTVSLSAAPSDYYVFSCWQINSSSGNTIASDNPASLIVKASIGTYIVQPEFNVQPGNPEIADASSVLAIAKIIAGMGGSTEPTAGVYDFANSTSFSLTAVPYTGWVFDHWIIAGNSLKSAMNFDPTNTPIT
jgi:hypothetical protein